MRITFDGTPKRIDLKECRRALQFYATLLFNKRTRRGLPLVVQFIDGYLKKEDSKGGCDYQDSDADLFILECDASLSRSETLKCLAHELVHIKQMRLGELVDTDHRSKILFRKKTVDTAKVNYWEMPHEIEAYGREVGLYRRYYDKFLKKKKVKK